MLACGIILLAFSVFEFFMGVGATGAEEGMVGMAIWFDSITALVAGLGLVIHSQKHRQQTQRNRKEG